MAIVVAIQIYLKPALNSIREALYPGLRDPYSLDYPLYNVLLYTTSVVQAVAIVALDVVRLLLVLSSGCRCVLFHGLCVCSSVNANACVCVCLYVDLSVDCRETH